MLSTPHPASGHLPRFAEKGVARFETYVNLVARKRGEDNAPSRLRLSSHAKRAGDHAVGEALAAKISNYPKS